MYLEIAIRRGRSGDVAKLPQGAPLPPMVSTYRPCARRKQQNGPPLWIATGQVDETGILVSVAGSRPIPKRDKTSTLRFLAQRKGHRQDIDGPLGGGSRAALSLNTAAALG